MSEVTTPKSPSNWLNPTAHPSSFGCVNIHSLAMCYSSTVYLQGIRGLISRCCCTFHWFYKGLGRSVLRVCAESFCQTKKCMVKWLKIYKCPVFWLEFDQSPHVWHSWVLVPSCKQVIHCNSHCNVRCLRCLFIDTQWYTHDGIICIFIYT